MRGCDAADDVAVILVLDTKDVSDSVDDGTVDVASDSDVNGLCDQSAAAAATAKVAVGTVRRSIEFMLATEWS